MKKVITWILSFTMMFAMSVTALAADATIKKNGGSAEANVIGNYAAGKDVTVYSVDITWSDLTFTYAAASGGVWNPGTHTYSGAGEAGWEAKTGTIVVTNHSNAGISAKPAYQANTGYESATITFGGEGLNEEGVLELDTADNGENGAAGTPTSGTITVTPGGTLPEGTANAVIGVITVTITGKTQITVKPDEGWGDGGKIEF